MQAYVDRGVYAGISTLIARRGKIVHATQFGWRDKEAQSPMSEDTIFRFYSMTKPIVCVALMALLEEARFTLLDPLAKTIPAFGGVKVLEADGKLVDPARPITLRDLMTHTSGLTYHFVDEFPVGKMYQQGQAPGREMFAGGSGRRFGAVSARLPAGVALAIQRRHRRRRPRDRGDLRPSPRGLLARTSVRAARDGRYGLRGSAGKEKPAGGNVWPPRRDRRRPHRDERDGSLGEGRERTARRFQVVPGRFSRGVRPRRPRPVWHDRRLLSLRPDAGQRRPTRRNAHSRAQDARSHARKPLAGGAASPRHWWLALARLRLRPRLSG